ncbi:MAG: DUF2062 domain-containing protein [Trichlorobacter sp.]|jgi:uncharacterized protein (TIGR03546 family)
MSLDSIKKRLIAVLSLDSHPSHIATGFAVGVFISFTPFFGAHTAMAIAAAFIFRLNKASTITGAWINTPITIVPVLVASHYLGSLLLGQHYVATSFSNLEWASLKQKASALILGSSILGVIAGGIGYGVIYWLVIRFRRKDPGLLELTKESLEVGEDLDPQ